MSKRKVLLGLFLSVICLSELFSGAQQEADQGVIAWTKYNSETPENSRDKWMKKALDDYAAETGIVIENIFLPYDQINSKLNVAVTTGGEVPDISYVDSQQQAFYMMNDTLTDLTDFVKTASWYKDISPRALEACTTPEGKILYVPLNIGTRVTYAWTELWPNGYPETIDGFLEEADRIKAGGKYPITFKASEKYGAEGLYYGLIKSFGGDYGDSEGKAAWASEAAENTLEFLRTLFEKEYAPEIDLAPGFDNERPFVQGDAASFSGISWSYVYMSPLTAPDGTIIDEGSNSIASAVKAGKIKVAPYLAAPGRAPVAALTCSALAIPNGARNIEGAKKFINWLMTTERNAECAAAIGGLPSVLPAMLDERFQTEYWKQVAGITDAYGSSYPALVEYDKALTKLAQTFEELLSKPNLDIMTELEKSQTEVNR